MDFAIRRLSRVDGRLPGLAVLALFCAYINWAALHDIAQQLQRHYVAECIALAIAVPCLIAVVRYALSLAGRTGQILWLSATGGWILLLDLAAWDAVASGWTRTEGRVEYGVIGASVPFVAAIVYRIYRIPGR